MRPSVADADLPRGAIAKYYLYRAAMAAGFTAPVWYYYLKVNVESYALVGAIDAVWWSGLILFEIPTGYLGDRIGRRNSLLIASGTITVAQLAMALSSEFVHFAVVLGVWALGQTFRSGTADAWLYDTLKARMDENDFARVRGRGNAIMYVVLGVTGVLGGYIADVWIPYAYVASATVTALSVPVLLSFPVTTPGHGTGDASEGTGGEGGDGSDEAGAGSDETGNENDEAGDEDDAGDEADDEDDADDQFTVLDALPVVREHFSKPPLRSFVPYLGLFFGVYWGVNFFIQPFSVETLGFSVSGVGWLYGGFTAVAAAVSYKTDAIREVVGIRRWFYVAPPLLGVLFVGVAVAPAVAIPVFVAMRGSRGAMTALANQYINDRVESVGRATVLSTAGMVYNLVTVPFELAAGYLADAIGMVETIGLFGAILVVGSAAFLAVGSPFDAPSVGVEEAAD